MPGTLSALLHTLEFGLLAAAMAGLFHYVPNTSVRWRHAIAGALFVAVGFEAAKKGLAWYVETVPTYSAVYGAFATMPILLLWIYLGWVIVLLGAVIAAYAPSLQMRVVTRPASPGQAFELALEVLGLLDAARRSPQRGCSLAGMAAALRADPLQLEPLLERLARLDWISLLDEGDESRFVLLCEPDVTPILPLVHLLLLAPGSSTAVFRARTGLDSLRLREVLAV
jgi:membrane protein